MCEDGISVGECTCEDRSGDKRPNQDAEVRVQVMSNATNSGSSTDSAQARAPTCFFRPITHASLTSIGAEETSKLFEKRKR